MLTLLRLVSCSNLANDVTTGNRVHSLGITCCRSLAWCSAIILQTMLPRTIVCVHFGSHAVTPPGDHVQWQYRFLELRTVPPEQCNCMLTILFVPRAVLRDLRGSECEYYIIDVSASYSVQYGRISEAVSASVLFLTCQLGISCSTERSQRQ